MKYVLILLISFVGSLNVYAQSNCNNSLFEASKLYESGLVQMAIDTLEPCYTSQNIEKDERLDAARLLALCYLFFKNSEKVDNYALEMIQIEPNYQKHPFIDPKDLTAVLDQYRVEPALSVGFMAGVSGNQFRLLKNYSPANISSTYTARSGLTAGILGEYRLGKSSAIRLIASINSYGYVREMDNVAGTKKSYTENINSIGVPLFFRRYVTLKNWKLHMDVGGQYNYVISSFADMQSTSLFDGTTRQTSTSTSPYRNRSLYGGRLGFGMSKTAGTGQFDLNISYVRFISNFAVPEARYDNVDFLLATQYFDPDFSLNSIAINISYQFEAIHRIVKH